MHAAVRKPCGNPCMASSACDAADSKFQPKAFGTGAKLGRDVELPLIALDLNPSMVSGSPTHPSDAP